MVDFPMTDEELLETISKAREMNNKNWMNLIKIALKHAPEETKNVLSDIADMDDIIRTFTKRLVHENRPASDRP